MVRFKEWSRMRPGPIWSLCPVWSRPKKLGIALDFFFIQRNALSQQRQNLEWLGNDNKIQEQHIFLIQFQE